MKTWRLYLVLVIALGSGSEGLWGQISLLSRIRRLPVDELYHVDEESKTNDKADKKKLNAHWIAFSDRDENLTYLDPFGREELAELNFLQPLLVLKTRNGYCKVIAYDRAILAGPGLVEALFGIPMKKYRLADRKKVQYLGWVKESQLLHSPNALVDKGNLRPLQYLATISHPKMVSERAQYLDRDSILMAHAPGYRKETKSKVENNGWMYVYKKLERPAQYLVGTEPWIDPDSAYGAFGWVTESMVLPQAQNLLLLPVEGGNGGEAGNSQLPVHWVMHQRLGLRQDSNVVNLGEHPFPYRSEWMLPVRYPITERFDSARRRMHTYIPTDLIDVQESRVYNCIGQPFTFKEYQALQQQMKTINLVVVFEDGKEGKEAIRNMISSFQDLSQRIQANDLTEYTFNFAAIGYMDRWVSDSLNWTSSFSDWLRFIQRKAEDASVEYASNEHVMLRGIHDAAKLLKGKEREHNIVVVVGSKINAGTFPKLFDRVVSALSKASANLLFLQSSLGKSQSYSDFVLQAKRMLDEVGKESRTYRQQIIVDNNLVKYRNELQEMNRCGNGYLYDFPDKSMQKGGLFFPNVNGNLCPNLLESVMDSLLEQIKLDNVYVLTAMQEKFVALRHTKQNVNSHLRSILEEQGLVGLPDQYANTWDDPFFVKVVVNYDPRKQDFKPCFLIREDAFAALGRHLRRVVIDPKENPNGDSEINFQDRRRWYRELRRTYLDRNQFFNYKGAIGNVSLATVIFMETGFPVNNEYFHQLSLGSIQRKAEQEELLPAIQRFYRDILQMEAYPTAQPRALLRRGQYQYCIMPVEMLP